MAKTLGQIQKQIAKLQQEADALKSKEVGGVIERVKEAIAHYGLTAAHLFGGSSAAGKPARKTRGARKKVAGRKSAGRKSVSPMKFRDDAGNAWTGHGRRPKWFTDAIAGGKKPEDLAAKS